MKQWQPMFLRRWALVHRIMILSCAPLLVMPPLYPPCFASWEMRDGDTWLLWDENRLHTPPCSTAQSCRAGQRVGRTGQGNRRAYSTLQYSTTHKPHTRTHYRSPSPLLRPHTLTRLINLPPMDPTYRYGVRSTEYGAHTIYYTLH